MYLLNMLSPAMIPVSIRDQKSAQKRQAARLDLLMSPQHGPARWGFHEAKGGKKGEAGL